jgi:hypothetical protein
LSAILEIDYAGRPEFEHAGALADYVVHERRSTTHKKSPDQEWAPGERDGNFGAGLIDPLKALQLADPRSATTAPTIRQR